MKTRSLFIIASSIAIGFASCSNSHSSKNVTLNDIRDSASYSIGLSIATNLAQEKLDSLNLDAFVRGYNDAKNRETALIAIEEIHEIIQEYAIQELKKQHKESVEAGKNFLATNATKEGVKTTESGLQYEIIHLGTGKTPEMYDSVTMNYHGTKIDGSVFESTKGGATATISLSPMHVIPGLIEGLSMFPVGSRIKLYVPEDLAYGVSGYNNIAPFETLIFEIDILDTKKGQAPSFDMSQLQQMMGN